MRELHCLLRVRAGAEVQAEWNLAGGLVSRLVNRLASCVIGLLELGGD